MDEMVEVVTADGTVTGKLVSKQTAHKSQVLHRVVGLLLQTADGRYIVQYRPPEQGWRYYDLSVGGHVDVGEVPERAIVREAHEELSVSIDPKTITLVAKDFLIKDTYPEINFNACHLMVLWQGTLPSGWVFKPNQEVPEVRLLQKDELIQLYQQNPNQCSKGMLASLKMMGW